MMEDEKASDKKSTVDSKKMGAAIETRIQQVAAQTVAMALDSGAGGSYQGGSSTKKEYVPVFPCPACGLIAYYCGNCPGNWHDGAIAHEGAYQRLNEGCRGSMCVASDSAFGVARTS